MRRVRMTAYGDVQGVFFRASTRDEARRLGLTGWAENAPDGSVVVEAQGPPAKVDELVSFVRRGPGHAQVFELDLDELDVDTDDRSFDVR